MLPCLNRVDAPRSLQGRDHSVFVVVDPPAADEPRLLQETKQSLRRTNVVCTARSGGPINIKLNAMMIKASCVLPKFPSCIGRVADPSSSLTHFRPGFKRCAGGNSTEKGCLAIYLATARDWIDSGLPLRVYNFEVHNYVSAAHLPFQVNLKKMHSLDPVQYRYTDLFPGLIVSVHQPDHEVSAIEGDGYAPAPRMSQATIFRSGNINVVGVFRLEHAIQTLDILFPTLLKCREYGFPSILGPLDADHARRVLAPPTVLHFQVLMARDKKAERARRRGQHDEAPPKRRKANSGAAVATNGKTDEASVVYNVRLQGASRVYEVDISPTGDVQVRDADNEAEAEEAKTIVCRLFASNV
jgi:TATA-box binding protein (TBP) (component of TFIID and TFIIIB)